MSKVRNIYSRSECPDGFCFGDFMKTLAELAEEYKQTAEELKKKIDELKRRDPGSNPAAIHRTIDIYEDMYRDAMISYHKLKNYYNK